MLTATLSYSADTNTVTVTDLASPGPVYAAYQLVDRRPGVADVVLPSTSSGAVTTWNPQRDDCYQVVLQGGTRTGSVFQKADESAVLYQRQQADHLEACADCFYKLAKRSPGGHPLDDALQVEVRRLESAYCLGESNPDEASLILTTTPYPR